MRVNKYVLFYVFLNLPKVPLKEGNEDKELLDYGL